MTEQEKIEALVRYRLDQAAEALAAADLNMASDMLRSAINRGYYAMFYAVLALLVARRTETSRHSGAIAQFDQQYVKPQLFGADLSRWLHQAFLRRQAADYGAEPTVSRDEVGETLQQARAFVAEVREYFERRPSSDW